MDFQRCVFCYTINGVVFIGLFGNLWLFRLAIDRAVNRAQADQRAIFNKAAHLKNLELMHKSTFCTTFSIQTQKVAIKMYIESEVLTKMFKN